MRESNVASLFYWVGWLIFTIGAYCAFGGAVTAMSVGAAIFIFPISKHIAGGAA